MGRHLMHKTGNVEAVTTAIGAQVQYSRITDDELQKVVDAR